MTSIANLKTVPDHGAGLEILHFTIDYRLTRAHGLLFRVLKTRSFPHDNTRIEQEWDDPNNDNALPHRYA